MTYRSQYEIDRWLDQTCRDIERMISLLRSDYWDYNLDHACTEYSGCPFQTVCSPHRPKPGSSNTSFSAYGTLWPARNNLFLTITPTSKLFNV